MKFAKRHPACVEAALALGATAVLSACSANPVASTPLAWEGAAAQQPAAQQPAAQPPEGQQPASQPPAPAAVRSGSLNVLLGRRQLDEDFWFPVDEPMVLAFEYAHEPAQSVVGWEIGLSIGADEQTEFVPLLGADVEFTNAAVELYGGVRKTFLRESIVQPYFGLGLTMMSIAVEGSAMGVSVDDDDWTFGAYLHGGLQFALGESFRLGLDVRVVRGTDVDVFDVGADADYDQVALLFGFAI